MCMSKLLYEHKEKQGKSQIVTMNVVQGFLYAWKGKLKKIK